MKGYLKYLLDTFLSILVIGILGTPIALPIILVAAYGASKWWFLLTILYIPMFAFIMYMTDDEGF